MATNNIFNPNYANERAGQSVGGKRDRTTYEQQSRVRYARVKDVGSKLPPGDHRNKRIVEIAEPLPEGNRLTSRAIYWFVTIEMVDVIFQDAKLFRWEETVEYIDGHGVVHYLYKVDFHNNKMGLLAFRFPDSEVESVMCCSTVKSKKVKLSNYYGSSAMQIDEESESAHSAQATPQALASNTNQLPYHPYANSSPSGSNFSPSSFELEEIFSLLDKADQNVVVPPVTVSNGMQISSNEALIVNILLLVPDKPEFIQMIDAMLLAVGFTKEVSSTNQQNLYSQKRLNTTRHVLLLPYGNAKRFYAVEDYLPSTNEVILLLVNQDEQQNDLMAIASITNINRNPNNIWKFTIKTPDFESVDLNYTTLALPIQVVLSIEELREVALGGACWKKELSCDEIAEQLKSYFLQWTLARVAKNVVQNIFLCFKYEPKKVKAFTEYAATTLAVLDIEYDLEEATTVNGSVLVYLRCPGYIQWHILQRKDDIFDTLTEDGLTKIYECFICDVETSLQRLGNEEFVDELTYLKEQMISDGIAEQPTNNRFCLLNPKLLTMAMEAMSSIATVVTNTSMPDEVERMEVEDVPIEGPPTIGQLPIGKRQELEEKWTELKKFDNKLTKTLEDCYNKDKLLQQLFTFKQEKNVKIAVRVFISSASAGLATNVAKLMRKFNGKSIVDCVHSGLQIANTIVEWNQSGIVHIGELKHANAVAVLFDVQDSVQFDFTDDVAQKMVSFIQKWNTEHRYSSDEFNSHRFVRDFLQYTMNISLIDRFQGPLGYYMDHVMRTGDPTPRLFSKNNGVIVFKTHEELEETERAIKSKLSEDELKLMKIFHRGFQLQEAANDKDVSSCSYGLPTNGLEILNDSGKPMKY